MEKSKEKKSNAEYWQDRIAKATWEQYNSMEEKNRALLEFYEEAGKNIREELYRIAEKYSKEGVLSLSDMHKQNRLKKLNENIENIIQSLGREVQHFTAESMKEGFLEVHKNVGTSLGQNDFAQPNKKLMEKLMNDEWAGGDFSSRLWGNQKKLAAALNSQFLLGLQQGKTVTEIAVNLNNIMNKGFNAAHRLVRTESMHYLNNAALQGYKDGNVRYVRIWAAIDERTCDTCGVGGEHDRVYPIEKAPVLPLHANCRCTYLPVVGEELEEWLKSNGDLESDIGKSIYESVLGISEQRKAFEKGLKLVENKDAKTLLEQSLKRVTIKRASGKKSKYSADEKILYLAKNAPPSTTAHELFHEIDITYGLTRNGLLSKSVQNDFNALQNRAAGYGKSVEEMLRTRYPDAFREKDAKLYMKEEYRAISDIIHGCSNGEIFLGYGHGRPGYWKKPFALERETFAQYGRVLYNSDTEVLKMFKALFPSVEAELSKTIRRMIK